MRRSSGLGSRIDGRSAQVPFGAKATLPILALLILSLMASCRHDEPAAPNASAANAANPLPERELHGLVMRQTSLSGLAWVLRAREGVSQSPSDPVQLTDLKIEFYDGQKTIRSVLTSKRGEIDAHATTLLAQDSVVVVTADGDRLETDTLRWDPTRERMTTQSFFRFHHGVDYLTGVGFDADPDLKSYSITRDVHIVGRSQDPARLLDEEERH